MPPEPAPPAVTPPPPAARRLPLIIASSGAVILFVGALWLLVHDFKPLVIGRKPAPEGLSVAPSASAVATSTRQYLLFQLATDNPVLSGDLTGSKDAKATMERQVDELIALTGGTGDHATRELGFVPALGWDSTDVGTKQLIDDAFAIALEKDIAVGFHIDDSMFWLTRKDLWSDKTNVEWRDWQGTVIPHRIISWANNGEPFLPPPMCYNSPTVTKEATRLATDVMGREIKKGVDELHAVRKDYLFAGVIAGWETRIINDENPPGATGYCALTNLGYSATNPPADIDATLQGVVSSWIMLWDQGLEAAGVPKDKVYTHIAYPLQKAPPGADKASYEKIALRNIYKDSDPNVTAFNDYSRPGFSVYGTETGGLPLFDAVYATLAAHSSPPWGVSEGNDTDLFGPLMGKGKGPSTMEEYLGKAFNHGAVYVDLFGWTFPAAASPFKKVLVDSASVEAYKKFLSGATLEE